MDNSIPLQYNELSCIIKVFVPVFNALRGYLLHENVIFGLPAQ